MISICNIVGCPKNVHGYGLCHRHYSIKRKYGNPNYVTEKREKHGMYHTREYFLYRGMKHRCVGDLGKNNKYYCDKGIEVCKEWRDSFLAFYSDMGKCPSNKHTIDRIDNNKGYSKDNCRWATPYEQTLNRGKNSNNKSGYIGVSTVNGRWGAFAMHDRKAFYLGTYDTKNEAAYIRDQFMLQLHNGLCTTNFEY